MAPIATSNNAVNSGNRTQCAVKTCKLCSRKLPVTDFFRRGPYRHSYCKPCHRDRTQELRDAKRLRSNTTSPER